MKDEKAEKEQKCLVIIPGTFAVCGEMYGDKRQYCSDKCYKESLGK
jgi:predicted nucleic acid-binding Zn ribbon protein